MDQSSYSLVFTSILKFFVSRCVIILSWYIKNLAKIMESRLIESVNFHLCSEIYKELLIWLIRKHVLHTSLL